MLRLPATRYHRPERMEDAIGLLVEHGADARVIAGGTDLVPNMKHGLFEPRQLISLGRIPQLAQLEVSNEGESALGAGVSLSRLAAHPTVRLEFTALGEAAAHVAGPQIRNRATIGGNVCLETRCTYYNQTRFWRDALGYCLKKDGTVCHVTRVGKKCVAAHSADTPPVLHLLDAVLDLHGPEGERTVPVRDFFIADGIWNTRRQPDEILARIRIPAPSRRRRITYLKLRQRKSIDFPLLTVAVAVDGDPRGPIEGVELVVTGLGSRPRVVRGLDSVVGHAFDDDMIDAVAERAFKQCHPLENITVDPEWRRAMVPVQVRRALEQLRDGREPRTA